MLFSFQFCVEWSWKRRFELAVVSCRIVCVLFSAPHWSTSCSGLHFKGGTASSSTQRRCVCRPVWEGTTISITDHNITVSLVFFWLWPEVTPFKDPVIPWCVRNDFALACPVCRCCWVYMKQSHRPTPPFPPPLMTTYPYELHNQAGLCSYWKLSPKQITWQRIGLREGSKL